MDAVASALYLTRLVTFCGIVAAYTYILKVTHGWFTATRGWRARVCVSSSVSNDKILTYDISIYNGIDDGHAPRRRRAGVKTKLTNTMKSRVKFSSCGSRCTLRIDDRYKFNLRR